VVLSLLVHHAVYVLCVCPVLVQVCPAARGSDACWTAAVLYYWSYGLHSVSPPLKCLCQQQNPLLCRSACAGWVVVVVAGCVDVPCRHVPAVLLLGSAWRCCLRIAAV